MSVRLDYENLAERLLAAYSKGMLAKHTKQTRINDRKTTRMVSQVTTILNEMNRYHYAPNLDKALDAIDLSTIYSGVDKRESEAEDANLGYQDFVVLETLDFFKNRFFKWVTKPQCLLCHDGGENIEAKGARGPPTPNPDEISVIEVYWCKRCTCEVLFPRINNPGKLLETRMGRCGEWVNCFILILRAVLGEDSRIRYVWNQEDHVWCEYYSDKLRRYVHLDPCENAFDNPLLYCENWGKQMSWVIGIGEDCVVDLSSKYITASKQLSKQSVADEKSVASYLEFINQTLLQRYWQAKVAPLGIGERKKYLKLYYDVILLRNTELNQTVQHNPLKLASAPQGRQTGSAEWTKSRGESG